MDELILSIFPQSCTGMAFPTLPWFLRPKAAAGEQCEVLQSGENLPLMWGCERIWGRDWFQKTNLEHLYCLQMGMMGHLFASALRRAHPKGCSWKKRVSLTRLHPLSAILVIQVFIRTG